MKIRRLHQRISLLFKVKFAKIEQVEKNLIFIKIVVLIDQRMIMAYIDEVRIKLGTLLKILFLMKIVWVVDFAKTNMKIEAPLVLNHVSYICTPKNPRN